MSGVFLPPNTNQPISCQIPITSSTSWNIQISGQDSQGNEKLNVASICSNQTCDITLPPDSGGVIYINANPSSSNIVGWNRSFFLGELDYFDNSDACAAQPKTLSCDYLSYITWQVSPPSPPSPPPNQPTKFGCNDTCDVLVGGPVLSSRASPPPPICQRM